MFNFLKTFLLLFCVNSLFANDYRGDTIDIRSHRLSIDLTDFTNKILRANARLIISSRMNGVKNIQLDLLKLNVDSVKVNGYVVSFSYNDSVIGIPILPGLNQGDSATLDIFYRGKPVQMPGDFGGFYWTNTYAFNIGVSFLAVPHTYGRVWFPCFDNFEERSLYEFFITTRDNHKAFCNGTLKGVVSGINSKTWHWNLEQEIPSYLASVAVSDYATLADTVEGMNGTIPIQLAARAPDTMNLKNAFIHLKDAFHIQENHWGPYQWERVGFCIVPFSAGAMEHATNVSFMNLYLTALKNDAETTMAHELSHHWFGDLVTCKTADEMWLNEGWASYNEHLFLEKFYGDSVYRKRVSENHELVLHQAHINDDAYLPVSSVPTRQIYGTTVYRKGADMIHTLRYYMGDSLFFHCVKDYLTDYSFQNSTTEQLRDYLSQCSGINLDDYFADWIYAPGFPHFSLEWLNQEVVFDDGVNVKLLIRQRLHQTNHFFNNVPVKVTYFDENWNRTEERVNVSGECTSHSTKLQFIPVYIAIDFDAQLQDAITDEWKIIRSPGTYNFGVAKAILNANSVLSPALVRIEYNWIRPEPMKVRIPDLHLHDKHYWTVDGANMESIRTQARFDYNGTDPSLDAAFVTNREDSMIVMYRANADSEWVKADSFQVMTGANVNDKQGYANVYNLKKGQYTFAIYNSSMIDTTTAEGDCTFNAIPENILSKSDFQVFPNPSDSRITVTFQPNVFASLAVYDLPGRKMMERQIEANENRLEFSLNGLSAGSYIVTLTGALGEHISRVWMKQ